MIILFGITSVVSLLKVTLLVQRKLPQVLLILTVTNTPKNITPVSNDDNDSFQFIDVDDIGELAINSIKSLKQTKTTKDNQNYPVYQNNRYCYEKDYEIGEKLTGWRQPFMWILLRYYQKMDPGRFN